MSEKGTFAKLVDSGKELLKDGEEFIEDKTGSSIDYFSESEKEKKAKDSLEKGKKIQKEETQKKLFDAQSNIILSKIIKQLKDGFEDFKTKINNVPELAIEIKGFGLTKKQKEKHIKTAQKEYDEIMKMLSSYKNDGDLKKGYESVNTKITEWIGTLEKQDSNSIVDSVKHNLENLKADMGIINGKTKEEIEKTKVKIKEKYQESEQNNEIESILTKYGIPAGIAGIIVSFLGFLGIGKEEKTMFTQAITFMKSPIEGIKGFLGFGKDKKETNKEVAIIKKGKIKESGDYNTYTNANLEIKLEKEQIKSVKIDGVDYKFNQKNIGKLSFIQNSKDILKIGDKEIDLFTLIKNIKENKDSYIVYENFNNSNDLKIEKA